MPGMETSCHNQLAFHFVKISEAMDSLDFNARLQSNFVSYLNDAPFTTLHSDYMNHPPVLGYANAASK